MTRSFSIVSLLAVVLILGSVSNTHPLVSLQTSASTAPQAYVQPVLLDPQTTPQSVIVTGKDSQAAAHAVAQVGGRVNSDLWIINAVSAHRTPGYSADDTVPAWSAAGPTLDGFAKPDIVAPGSQIVSYMYNDPIGTVTQALVKLHPDYSAYASLFRMNGTSMAAAATSGVVALMLQAHPELTPDQVKFRLIYSARPALDANQQPVYNTLQQGMGRVWAPDAVLGVFPANSAANSDMNLTADLAHGYTSLQELDYHYQGPIQSMPSDDHTAVLYYIRDTDGSLIGLGVRRNDGTWMSSEALVNARMGWAGARVSWAGGLTWSGAADAFASARMGWAGARISWAGARMSWAGGMSWTSARMSWAGNNAAWSTARMSWAGAVSNASTAASNAIWIDDGWTPPTVPPVRPPPIAANRGAWARPIRISMISSAQSLQG